MFFSENYQKLRKSSFASVLDVEEVAIAWTKEYTRLRKRLWAPPSQLEQFEKEIEREIKEEEAIKIQSPIEEKKEQVVPIPSPN